MHRISGRHTLIFALLTTLFFLTVSPVSVSAEVPREIATMSLPEVLSAQSSPGHSVSYDFLWYISIILISAKVSGLLEKIKQPAVLGELLAGVILGNLALVGITLFEPMRDDQIIKTLSELGVIILLFQIGLETNITQMKRVGVRAFLVALAGVVVPFVLGTFVASPLLLPDSSFNTRLFIGAVLTATSVGITARVFKDLAKLHTKEAQIVLGAAVIDDVLGLVILAVVSMIVSTGSVTFLDVMLILGKSMLFLIGAILIGQYVAKSMSTLFSKIQRGTGMKFTITLAFGLIMSYIASLVGLAPIIGAFAAGLVLDQVVFNDYDGADSIQEIYGLAQKSKGETKKQLLSIASFHSHRHIEYIIAPLGYLLVPVFFVMTGFSVDIRSFYDVQVLLLAGGITVIAVVGKLSAGIFAGNVRKFIVGIGMIPRGEVGLIFAVTGKALGVVDDKLYSAIVVMIILTTLVTPPILTLLLKKDQ